MSGALVPGLRDLKAPPWAAAPKPSLAIQSVQYIRRITNPDSQHTPGLPSQYLECSPGICIFTSVSQVVWYATRFRNHGMRMQFTVIQEIGCFSHGGLAHCWSYCFILWGFLTVGRFSKAKKSFLIHFGNQLTPEDHGSQPTGATLRSVLCCCCSVGSSEDAGFLSSLTFWIIMF